MVFWEVLQMEKVTRYYIGIDTSCYTTSVGIVDQDKNIIQDLRIPLTVKSGQKGLRQSDGFYQHVLNLPNLIEKVEGIGKISAIAYSKAPRPIEGSYMPVFRAGESFAKVLAKSLCVPLMETTHQEGHIRIGLKDEDLESEFLCVHMSGGTLEILKISRVENGFSTKILGSTKDISAGQLLDRIGQKMGFDFPSGKAIDSLAIDFKRKLGVKISVSEGNINFSGVETQLKKLIEKNEDFNEVSAKTMTAISDSLKKALEYHVQKTKSKKILFVGGVASSKFLSNDLANNIADTKLIFPLGSHCVDNALGVALLAADKFENQEKSR